VDIEAVTVCVGYGDFLRAVAPHNRPHLDRWVVVTTPDDEETRDVCRQFSIDAVLTEEQHRDGDFSKGRLIDKGLAHTTEKGWTLHLDGDIVLPTDMKVVLEDAHLDEKCLYGCDRLNVVGYDTWKRVQAKGLACRSNPWMVGLTRPDTTVGARVANVGHGYTPIGFFQLWHGSATSYRGGPARKYPKLHGTAARTDVQFALHFDRRYRHLIPELLVWHVESDKSGMGANWRGRTTPRFGPAPKKPGGKAY
jgi:hypothetical protein